MFVSVEECEYEQVKIPNDETTNKIKTPNKPQINGGGSSNKSSGGSSGGLLNGVATHRRKKKRGGKRKWE
jgi:hypothetical protein